MKTFTIIGAGYMGSAMAWPLHDNGHKVNLVGTHLDKDIIQSCKNNGYHPKLRRFLPEGVNPLFIDELDNVIKESYCIIGGINSSGIQWFSQIMGAHLQEYQSVLMITKGVEVTSSGEIIILPDVLYSKLPDDIRDKVHIAAIGGPCIAGELAGRRQTGVVVGSCEQRFADEIASQLRTSYYHIRTTNDILSLEICAALKNAYAMAVGFSLGWLESNGGIDQAGAMSSNMEAAIFATAIGEMEQFLLVLNGDIDYASSFAGAGDLFVTCRGGRSSKAGKLLGSGVRPEDIHKYLPNVTLESIELVKEVGRSFSAIATKYQFKPENFPLMNALSQVILENQSPNIVLEAIFRDNQS